MARPAPTLGVATAQPFPVPNAELAMAYERLAQLFYSSVRQSPARSLVGACVALPFGGCHTRGGYDTP